MAGRSGPRNSSVKLLRILSMLMIVASHCVMFSDMNLLAQPLGVNKILIETFLYPGGKIGVVAFFSISAWYLSEAGGVRAGLRRVWILEREMLFWSLTLLAVTAVVNRSLVGPELAVRSLMPITTSLWWYPTAYAVFLLFFPFLTQGLRSLGKTAHGALCTIMVVLYTVLDMVMPLSAVGLPGGNVRSFIYIYTLIAYYRWYMKPLTTATAWWTLAGGYALIVVGALGGGLLYQHTGKLQTLQVYLGKVEFRLPVLMVGLTMFVLFERHEFHNHAVNAVAASTFGVYLISEYPTVRQWIWNNPWLDFGGLYRSPAAFVLIVLSVCAVFAGCVVLDAVRRLLFRITIDRRRGRWFDLLWEHLRRKLRHADYRTEHIENR